MNQVKKLLGLTLFTFSLSIAPVMAQQTTGLSEEEVEHLRNTAPDNPGTGAFPAIKLVESGLADQVVYRPANLADLGDTKLGIYVFGNGGCTDDAAHSRFHLLEVASHGYLAIVPGAIYTGQNAMERPEPTAGNINQPATRSAQLSEAIDWALAENSRPASPYFGLIDTDAVAVSGFSCGGIQALLNAKDERVVTVLMMNSGLFVNGPTVMAGMETGKELLEDIHTSTLYILGGLTDIAYENGMDDFSKINHVPVAVASINKGHGGTYWEPNGGQAAQIAVDWLQWQLRGDETAAQTFIGEHCGLCQDPEWDFDMKGFMRH